MQCSSRKAWLVLWLLGAFGCSLATDFDRDKIGELDAGGGFPDGGMGGMDARPNGDGMVTMDAPPDGTDARPPEDATSDTGPLPETGSQCTSHNQCPANQLCCGGQCVNTSVASQCTDCGQGCSTASANTCNNRVCGCDNAAACTGGTYCVANNSGISSCVECADNSACEGRTDGKKLCIAGRCAACDPSNNAGCMGTTPICSGTSLTCVKCTMGSSDNCAGNTVCTASGACGGCDDATDCATPTAPICDMAVAPTVCRGCGSDTECGTQMPTRPLCSSDGRCGVCKAVANAADVGCDITSATPACRLNLAGQYQCQGCNASAQCAPGRPNCRGGRCVECAPAANGQPAIQCADPTKPFCDATGVCQTCTMAGNNANMRNAFCASADATKPFCHEASGRCVECTATEGCGTAPNNVCLVNPANPSLNDCVQCATRANCTDATKPYCDLIDHTCKGCGAIGANLGCLGDVAHPICDAPSGRCAECVGTMGCTGVNGSCLAGANPSLNDCVDCTGAVAGECTAPAVCNTTTHMCVGCTMPSHCDDNNACTQNVCTGNVCSNPPLAAINDGIGCTDDSCSAGVITHAPNNAFCAGLASNDAFSCTVPTCNPAMGDATTGCIEVPTNALCNDMLDCTTDVCAAGTGCQITSTCTPPAVCTEASPSDVCM